MAAPSALGTDSSARLICDRSDKVGARQRTLGPELGHCIGARIMLRDSRVAGYLFGSVTVKRVVPSADSTTTFPP